MILGFNIGFLEVSWVDTIDILLVSFLLYQLYKLMKGSVAVKIFLGILSLYLIYLIVKSVQMELLSIILGQFMGVGVIAAIILFQPEIRKFLLLIGRTTSLNKENIFKNFVLWKKKEQAKGLNVTPVIDASKILGRSNTGALIVFTKDSPLKFYVESGDLIDAVISKRLLISIFNKYSPLHDGAVIIYNGKIAAARCILPVSAKDDIPANFGLRHRAAIGMTETTDSLVLIVSEETGQLSISYQGELMNNLSPQEIRKAINTYLFEEDEAPQFTSKELVPTSEEKEPASSELGGMKTEIK